MSYGVLVTPFTSHAGPDVESRVARGHVAGDVPLPAPMASWLSPQLKVTQPVGKLTRSPVVLKGAIRCAQPLVTVKFV